MRPPIHDSTPRHSVTILLVLFTLFLPLTAAQAALIDVSFSNGTAITAANVPSAVGVSNGAFNTGDGRIAIESIVDNSLATGGFDAPGDLLTGEIGIRWGIQADHCLGAGGCGGAHHYIDATADLVMTIVVDPDVASWTIEVGLQSFGNLNGLADGGTLPICTSEMRAFASELRTVGAGVTANFDLRSGRLAVDDDGDCTQDTNWVKNEQGIVSVSGVGGGTFEVHFEQDASVRSEWQTNLFAIKNGSEACFRAGADPGDGTSFFNACDYPGLVFGEGDRDEDGLLNNEPNDGGVWVTDRVTGSAVQLTDLEMVDPGPGPYVPVLGGPGVALLAGALGAAGLRVGRRRRGAASRG